MSISNGFAGVSNCYVFKSRLQEYAQKASLMTPVYETLKEGPSHQPCFRSSVIVDNVRYDSLPGFFNRKAAEQSAAEVALVELGKLGRLNESSSYPVHETGLCKNLLQEYAQKMNFAIPSYVCRADEAPGRRSSYSCTVDIGGISYIGAAASSKKEAEIKAARTALLAIQSNTNGAGAKDNGNPQLTVLPTPKKMAEPDTKKEENEKNLKPKKAIKKRWSKKKLQKKLERATGDVAGSLRPQVVPTGMPEADKVSPIVEHVGSQLNGNQATGMPEADKVSPIAEHVGSQLNGNQAVAVTEANNNSQNGQTIASNFNPSHQEFSSNTGSRAEANDLGMLEPGVHKVTGAHQEAQIGTVVVPGFPGEKFSPENIVQ